MCPTRFGAWGTCLSAGWGRLAGMVEWRWGVDTENARSVECPYCGAGVGDPCVSESGGRANYHGERFAANTSPSDPICRWCHLPQSEHTGPDQETCPT